MQDFYLFIQQHWELSSVFAFLLVLLIFVESLKLKEKASQLSPAALTQLINHDNPAVIDIRSPELYKQGHIIGATSISANDLLNTKKIDKFKTQPIVIVCTMGHEAPAIATQLTKQGYSAQSLAGGIRAWRDAEMPLVKG